MTSRFPSYRGCRFPPEISHAVWLYHRFCLSSRDAEDLLAQRACPRFTRRTSTRTVEPTSPTTTDPSARRVSDATS